jgi:hypothetical protein
MIEDKQLQKLVMMGMEAAIVPQPAQYLGSKTEEDVILMWDRFLGMETTTATTLGFELFTSLSVPFFGVNPTMPRSACQDAEYLKPTEPWPSVRSVSTPAPTSRSGSSASSCVSPRTQGCL